MSEDNLPAVQELPELPISKYGDDVFAAVSSSTSFLPRLMLYGANSDLVKEEKVQVGYSLVEGKDTIIYMGREIEVFNLAFRPKALDMSGDPIVANHNHTSPGFKAIAYKADNEKNSKCVYGPEYLVWLPELEKFATFLMGSKTARRESGKMHSRLKKAATLKTKLYSNTDFKWHGPEIFPCSNVFQLPAGDEITDVVTKFLNPKDEEIEVVEETGEAERPR